MRQLYGIDENDPPEAVREKVTSRPHDFPPDTQELVSRTIERLLAVRLEPGEYQPQGEAVKRETFEAVTTIYRELGSQGPSVLVFDDLHWADAASAELLVHLLALAEEAPILFLCAFRPERKSPAWQVKQAAEEEYPHLYTEISLKPLSSGDSDTLVNSLLTISDLPEELRALILRKTDGNPFFLEEVVRSLIDSGAVVRDEDGMHWHAATKVEDIDLPDSLQALLVSRFDRLEEEARRTLQLASVIGRSFYYQVLKFVSDAAIALDKQLNTLQRVELIREAARLPEREYTFRHELTRDAAYNSILRRRSRQFHRRVGEAIETLFPDRLEEQAHRLAHHFEEARDKERSLKYYVMAGDAAAALYANTEAIAHYSSAMEMARRGDTSSQHLIHLCTNLGKTFELSGRYDEAIAIYHELEELAEKRGERGMELAALMPQATVHSTYTDKFDPERGRSLSNRILELALELGDRQAEAKALWNLLLVETFGGTRADQAIEHGEKALVIAREDNLRSELAYILNDISRVYYSAGRREEGWSALEESQAMWRDLGNLPMLADNLTTVARVRFYTGDLEGAFDSGSEALRVSTSIGNMWGQAGSLFTLGPTYLERGEVGRGLRALEDALKLAEQGGFGAAAPVVQPLVARIYGWLGAPDQGLDLSLAALSKAEEEGGYDTLFPAQGIALGALAYLHLQKGDLDEPLIERMRSVGLRAYLPDILTHKGQGLLGLGRAEEAREALQEAR